MDGAIILKRSWKLGNGFGSEIIFSGNPVLISEIIEQEQFTVSEVCS